MSRKETKEAAKLAEKQEQERRKAIADFNVSNMGRFWIDPDKVPTDEDIENAKKEYEEFTLTLNEKKDYLIADKTNALRVAKFMQTFIDKSIWHKRFYVGVLRFHNAIQEFIDAFDEENPVDLTMEYGQMQFAYLMFEDYGGVGIEAAEWMAENNDEYMPIYDKLFELNNWYEFQLKKSENLKAKWGAMSQGYYLNIIEGNDEDTIDPETMVNKETEKTDSETVEEKKDIEENN